MKNFMPTGSTHICDIFQETALNGEQGYGLALKLNGNKGALWVVRQEYEPGSETFATMKEAVARLHELMNSEGEAG